MRLVSRAIFLENLHVYSKFYHSYIHIRKKILLILPKVVER